MAPTSVSSASTFAPSLVTLSLFKLSHTTQSSHSVTPVWDHLPNRDNLFAVFDRVRNHGPGGMILEHQVLKLVRGAKVMETIFFDTLANQVRLDEDRARSQHVPDNRLNVIILVKRPLLALRYQLQHGQIRKIQMNFKPEHGCDVALDNLRPIGMPIRDKDEYVQPPAQIPRPRPHTSQGTFSGPQSYSDGNTGDLAPTSGRFPPPPVQLPNSQNHLDYPDGRQTSHNFSRIISSVQDPNSTSQTDLTRTSIKRSASLSANTSSNLQSLNLPASGSQSLLPSPTFGSSQPPAAGILEYRPTSAPTTQIEHLQSHTDSISQMLPPRRQLPFPEKPIASAKKNDTEQPAKKKQASAKSTTAKETQKKSVRSTAAATKATRTKSAPRSTASRAPSKRQNAKAPVLTPPTSSAPEVICEEPVTISEDVGQDLSSLAPRKETAPRPVSNQTAAEISKETISLPDRRAVENIHERPLSAISDGDLNEKQAPAVNSEASTSDTAQQQLGNLPPGISMAEFMDQLGSRLRQLHDPPVPKPPPPPTSDGVLDEFAAQSKEDKAKIIDNTLYQCLNNPNFVTLCEEVEPHWKRVYLGF